jgi:hypothetical protein
MTADMQTPGQVPTRVSAWRNRDFRLLWAGETVWLFGSQVTTLALPLAAVLSLL